MFKILQFRIPLMFKGSDVVPYGGWPMLEHLIGATYTPQMTTNSKC